MAPSPATFSPTGAIAPNEGCLLNGIYFLFMTEGELNIWKMQILLVCQYSVIYSKKSIKEKP